jgi:hypothetical protein
MRSIENFISSKIEKFVNELTELKKILKIRKLKESISEKLRNQYEVNQDNANAASLPVCFFLSSG